MIEGPKLGVHHASIVEAQRTRKLLHTATAMFIDVSKLYPASVVAQGAAIAKRCRETSYNPLELRNALLSNPLRLRRLAHMAARQHERVAQEDPTSHAPTVVVAQMVAAIINTDFNWAQNMRFLEKSQLQQVLDDYSASMTSNDTFERCKADAAWMIKQRKQQLGLPSKLELDL